MNKSHSIRLDIHAICKNGYTFKRVKEDIIPSVYSDTITVANFIFFIGIIVALGVVPGREVLRIASYKYCRITHTPKTALAILGIGLI